MTEYNEHMAAVLESVGIPTDNVLSDPKFAVFPGGVILEPRIFLAFDGLTNTQRTALDALGIPTPRQEQT